MRAFPILVLTCLAISAGSAVAQDTHYWNLQYGARTTLLGGSVIGSVTDLGATYYNPAMVALIEKPEFVISAKAYEYESLTLSDGVGTDLDLSSSNFIPAPSLIAGAIRQSWMGNNRFSYAVLTRQRMNYDVDAAATGTADIIPGAGDDEYLTGFRSSQRMNDLWVGVSWAHRFAGVTSLGITQFVGVRSQSRRTQILAAAVSDSGEVGSAILINDYDYRNYRTLWKFGFAWDLDNTTVGITMTTPSVNLFGSGDALTAEVASGFDRDGDMVEDPYLRIDAQEDVDAIYKSPMSVGIGVGHKAGDFHFHVSGEWYDKVSRYDVLQTVPYTVQTTGETAENRMIDEAVSVTNFGIGIEHTKSETLSLYGSFNTDFSAAVNDPEVNHNVSSWDIYHIAGGSVISYDKLDLTLGLAAAFGSQEVTRRTDISDPANPSGQGGITKVSYSNWQAIIGFRFEI